MFPIRTDLIELDANYQIAVQTGSVHPYLRLSLLYVYSTGHNTTAC